VWDLERIIMKNWPQFVNIFGNQKNTKYMFHVLGILRNPIKHSRLQSLPPHMCYLCLGICGQFLYHIYRWRIGYGQRNLVRSYKCCMVFAKDKNETDCESEALKSAEEWMDIIRINSTKPPKKIIDNDQCEEWSIQLPEGVIQITLNKIAGENSELINNELKKVCIVDLSFRTDSPEVLDKVMQIGKHPYWVIEMKLFDKLDLENIRSNAEDMGTTTGGSRNASMSFKILTIDEKNDNNISIAKATIRGSLDYEDNEYILRLIYDGLKKKVFIGLKSS
jgi:hypothetical protein